MPGIRAEPRLILSFSATARGSRYRLSVSTSSHPSRSVPYVAEAAVMKKITLQALPELAGQPFHDVLVRTSAEQICRMYPIKPPFHTMPRFRGASRFPGSHPQLPGCAVSDFCLPRSYLSARLVIMWSASPNLTASSARK